MADTKRILADDAARAVKEALSPMVDAVQVLLFVNGDGRCDGCQAQKQLLEELASLGEKLSLRTIQAGQEPDMARTYAPARYPATVLLGRRDHGIRFYGVTAGAEFSTLLEDILMISLGKSGLDPKLESLVSAIDRDVHIQVMASLTCPYCPKMVRTAHQFAFVNDRIRSDMVEVAEYPELVKAYDVKGVPRTIINEAHSFEGLVPEGRFYMEVLKGVDPEAHRGLEQALRSMEGKRKARPPDPMHRYDVAVVGGGPAGMSAAVYAARKGLDVLLLSQSLGGQVNYTARVDNYLGVPEISGPEMVEAFRDHAESYEIAEELGDTVEVVLRDKGPFLLRTMGGKEYKASTVVYCGGKEYKRLGANGEERLMGKGVAFCATCDAPLYQGRSVAVVGGGNSAFTALRDLLAFASRLYLVHRRRDFKADPPLVKEVLGSGKVAVLTPYVVLEFQGKGSLEFMVIQDVETGKTTRLEVAGAFLEIGMEAKAEPLRGLLKLNQHGEVPVRKDMSTEVEGLFAAGDVTDAEEKQISIAVGQGAQAALSAHRYLMERGLASSRVPAKDTWI